MPKFILYACPQGPLADHIQCFLDQSANEIGRNAAHDYMPHCTLTGFFHDDPAVIAGDLELLSQLLGLALPTCPAPCIRVGALRSEPDWLGLELDSPWIRQLARDFANRANLGNRSTIIRSKTRLHLSLANRFRQHDQVRLEALAGKLVDPRADAS